MPSTLQLVQENSLLLTCFRARMSGRQLGRVSRQRTCGIMADANVAERKASSAGIMDVSMQCAVRMQTAHQLVLTEKQLGTHARDWIQRLTPRGCDLDLSSKQHTRSSLISTLTEGQQSRQGRVWPSALSQSFLSIHLGLEEMSRGRGALCALHQLHRGTTADPASRLSSDN